MLFARRHVRKAVLVLTLFLGMAWLLPSFFSAERYRRQLEAGLQQTLHRPVRFGATSFRLLPHPGFSIENAVVGEDPAFGSEPFARVERMDCDLRWRSLWHSRLRCSALHLERPTLNAVRNARGDWNVDAFLAARGNLSDVPVVYAPSSDLDIDADDARINFKIGDNKKPFAIVEVRAQLRFDARQHVLRYKLTGSPLRTDLSLPSPGPLELEGEWTPGLGLARSLNATLRVRKSLLYDWAPLIAGQNPEMYGVVDADIQLSGSLQAVKMEGDAQIAQLHRWELLPPSDSLPVTLHFRGEIDRDRHRASLDALEVTFAESHLHLLGSGEWTAATPTLDLVAVLEKSRVEDIEELSHRLWGYSFNRYKASGPIDGILTIQGPWGELHYGGFVRAPGSTLTTPAGHLQMPSVAVSIDDSGARLAPVKLMLAPRLEVVVEGALGRGPGYGIRGSGFGVRRKGGIEDASFPLGKENGGEEVPASRGSRTQDRGSLANPEPRTPNPVAVQYQLQISTRAAPISSLLSLARELGVKAAQGIEAQGVASTTLSLTGIAWPPQRPTLDGTGEVRDALLTIPGFHAPLAISHAEARFSGDGVVIAPLTASIGPSIFTGSLEHYGRLGEPWMFTLKANRLNLQEAFSWFADLHSKSPFSFLPTFPGLAAWARDDEQALYLFRALNAQGVFSTPSLIYRSVTLNDFRANVQVADRVIRVTDGQFQAGGGRGQGRLKVDVSDGLPKLAADFSLAKGGLPAVAGRLPAQLHKLRGTWSGSGHFETSGSTHDQLGANLRGEARIELKSVSLGDFDPIDAIARTVGWGTVQPTHREATIRSLTLNLLFHGLHATLDPIDLSLEGARVAFGGDYGFDGALNLTVHADFNHLTRHWLESGSDERSSSLRLTGPLHKPFIALGAEVSTARSAE